MNVGAIRSGLKARLKAAIPDLTCHDTMPGSTPFPAAVVAPDEPFIIYGESINRRVSTVRFRVVVLASATNLAAGQNTIDAYLSTGPTQTESVVDALYANDVALGGGASALVVTQVQDYGTNEVGGVSCVKADLLVEVTTTRS